MGALRKTIERNNLQGNTYAVALDWFSSEKADFRVHNVTGGVPGTCRSTILLGADILWLQQLAAPLAETLSSLAKRPDLNVTHFVMSHQTRSRMLDNHFFSLILEQSQHDNGEIIWRLEDTIEVHRDPDINIFVFARIRAT